MRVLCSFPGRAGDLLWALPTIRAVAEHFKAPVDLLIAGEFAGMIPLLTQQVYLGAVHADPAWTLTPPADWNPPEVVVEYAGEYDRTYHLGYRGWPAKPLPFETQDTLACVWNLEDGAIPEIDLGRAWITSTPWSQVPHRLCIGWSDCWFELKVGLLTLLGQPQWDAAYTGFLLPPAGSRWVTEMPYEPVGWLEAAQRIAAAEVFLGDCSALHVLAVALGKPVLLVEPMEARHNDIFYPLGKTGRVRLLTGNDGLPTHDARHCADALKEMLDAT